MSTLVSCVPCVSNHFFFLPARAAHEHLNGTIFDETEMEQEEPPEEWSKKKKKPPEDANLILHEDDHDDDDDDAEDPESKGTGVAEAVVPSSTVASQVECAERFWYLRCAYGKHPPKP